MPTEASELTVTFEHIPRSATHRDTEGSMSFRVERDNLIWLRQARTDEQEGA